MADHTTDRFTVLIGPEDLADHILDMADIQLDEELEERKQRLPDEALEKLDEVVPDREFEDVLLSLGWSLPGELMCSHGAKSYATDLVSLSEYAAERGLDEIDFDGDAPEGLCSYCWSNTRKTLDKEAEFGA